MSTWQPGRIETYGQPPHPDGAKCMHGTPLNGPMCPECDALADAAWRRLQAKRGRL